MRWLLNFLFCAHSWRTFERIFVESDWRMSYVLTWQECEKCKAVRRIKS